MLSICVKDNPIIMGKTGWCYTLGVLLSVYCSSSHEITRYYTSSTHFTHLQLPCLYLRVLRVDFTRETVKAYVILLLNYKVNTQFI